MDEELHESRWRRLRGFKVVTVLAFLILIRQLFVLQVLETDAFHEQAESNRQRYTWVRPERGVVYDRSGVQLVKNVPSFTISIVRADLPRQPDSVYASLGRVLELAPEQIKATLAAKAEQFDAWTPIPIKRNADLSAVAFIKERPLQFAGVHIDVDSTREYLDGPAFAHVLGYIGPMSAEEYDELRADVDNERRRYTPADKIGQAGIEALREKDLRGYPDKILQHVDSTGRVIEDLGVQEGGRAGRNVVLSLDARLQRRTVEILNQHIDRYGTATAIVMDVRTGFIRAMVDLPSYDNNIFGREIDDGELAALLSDPHYPLLNKAIGGAYAPGSVFKIITSIAALQEGTIFPTTTINCSGSIFVPSDVLRGQGERLNDWTPDGHGDQDVVAALANSCDIFFYQIAGGEPYGKWDGVGNKKLAEWARLFGLGRVTGLEMQGEVPGLVPDEVWKQRALPGEPWLKGNTYTYGIGQSYLQVTPIQMLNALVAVLNNGLLLRPQITAEIREADGRSVDVSRPQVIRQVQADPRWYELVRRGMVAGMEVQGVTENGAKYVGTSWDSAISEVKFAGKTGTAETGRGKQTHGWFAGYAPADNPEIAVIVFVENGSGSYNAAVRAEKIVRAYFGLPETAHDDTFK